MVSRLAARGREKPGVANNRYYGGDQDRPLNDDGELSPHTSDKACIASQTNGMFTLNGAILVV